MYESSHYTGIKQEDQKVNKDAAYFMCFKSPDNREDNTIINNPHHKEASQSNDDRNVETTDSAKYKESISKMMNTLLKMNTTSSSNSNKINEAANMQPRNSYVERVSQKRTKRRTITQQINSESKSTLWKDLFSFGSSKDGL